MRKCLPVVAVFLIAASCALGAAQPTVGGKFAGRVVTLSGANFPVKGCPKAVIVSWARAADTTVKHSLGPAKLARPHGTFTFVWKIPSFVQGPLYVYFDDKCVVKGLQQEYETYYSFQAP